MRTSMDLKCEIVTNSHAIVLLLPVSKKTNIVKPCVCVKEFKTV